MPRTPALIPESQFPAEAIRESVQRPPTDMTLPASNVFTWNIATVADSITPWGRNVPLRDRQLRDFWPNESFLAGAIANVSFRNAAYEWEIRGASENVENALTNIIKSAIAGDSFGWTNFILKFSEDLYTQDNGSFVELIRDPAMDATSQFKNEKAPIIGISHMDSNQVTRTGNPQTPIIYTDRKGNNHKLKWYQVIPFSDYPSSIERMNGVGVCAVTRALRLAQIMRSILIFKDEKVSGRHYKTLHMVSGVSRQDIADILYRGREEADSSGLIRYIDPAILASLDPEKPVSTASIDLANLPDGFDFDGEMRWYIAGLALCFGVDYQEFAPLPGGGIGSSGQSMVLGQKASGKGPAMFMKIAEAFKNYGVLPRGYDMIFEDRDEQRELDKQTLRKLYQEEMALALRNGFLTPDAARKIGIARGFYSQTEMSLIPAGYGEDVLFPKQNIGNTGGNTIAEDAGRTNSGPPNNSGSDRLQKEQNVIKVFNNIPDPETWIPPDVHVVNAVAPPPALDLKPMAEMFSESIDKMTDRLEKVVKGVSTTPDVHVTVEPTPVTIKNDIKQNTPPKNPPDEKDEVLRAIRILLRDG